MTGLQERERETLAWFYRCTALGVLVLIFLGGMVTTEDAGLAVPDWPLSFGSLNPEGWWFIPKVRLEHGHRLVGALIGLMVLTAMIWSFIRLEGSKLSWWSLAALLAVVAQGVMGGLRVTEVSTELAIFHGIFGQLVFCLVVVLGFTFSARWLSASSSAVPYQGPLALPLMLVGLIITQLVVAATLRHYNVGLAIPDFPLSNGRVVPEFTSWAVTINYTHRVLAFIILGVAAGVAFQVHQRHVTDRFLRRAALAVVFFILVQISLGIFTIWSAAAPVPTTLHVTNGALVLATSVVVAVRALALRSVAQVATQNTSSGTGTPCLAASGAAGLTGAPVPRPGA